MKLVLNPQMRKISHCVWSKTCSNIGTTNFGQQLNLSTSTSLKFPKREVDGFNLNYIEVGSGSHTLLCLPGTFGCIESDYGLLLQTIDLSKFRVVAWDPPGYGKSRPPNRDFSGDYFYRDAFLVQKLMQGLGHDKYSVLGWSVGGITGSTLSSEFPSHVNKLVLLATPAFPDDRTIALSKHLTNLDRWNKAMIAPMLKVYGEEYLTAMLQDWAAAQANLRFTFSTFDSYLKKITCPTLIYLGDDDKFLHVDHAHHLHKTIRNSKLTIIPKGTHTVHLNQPDMFLNALQDFLLND